MAGLTLRQRLAAIVPSTSPRSKNRLRQTSYPRFAFHGLRSAQLVSSMVVAGIMYYFIWHLRDENLSVPWTFILLSIISTATMLDLAFTIGLHCFTGLNPRLNLAMNAALLLAWAVGFSMLSWWSSGTISHECNIVNWHEDAGVSICRLYKALWSFTMAALLFTIGAIALDISVLRRETRLGAYTRTRGVDLKPTSINNSNNGNGLIPGRDSTAELWSADMRPDTDAADRDGDVDADDSESLVDRKREGQQQQRQQRQGGLVHPAMRPTDPLMPPPPGRAYGDGDGVARMGRGERAGYSPPPPPPPSQPQPFDYDTGYHGQAGAWSGSGEPRGQGFEGLRTG